MKTIKRSLFLVLSTTLLLSACGAGNGNNGGNSSQDVPPEPDDAFEILTDLDEVKEIHTEQQKEFLEYDGDYFSMPSDKYPDGLKHISDPNAVKLEWEYEPYDEDEFKNYTIRWGKEEDLSDAYEFPAVKTKSYDLYNSYLGVNYFQIVAHYGEEDEEASNIYSYTVDPAGPRNLRIDGMTNCRDMGGRQLEDGGYIKQGLIYRTSGTYGWGNNRAVVPDNLTDEGKETLKGQLGCITEIDVNSSGSNRAQINTYVGAYMDYQNGKHHLYRNLEPLKKVFETISNPDNYPLFYHCRIGTDRTGLCAIMISALLGLPENEIYKDYLFSNFGNIQEKRYIGNGSADDISKYIADIKEMPGETFKNQVYNFLLSIGVPKAQLDDTINFLTEGDTATGNATKQVVVRADQMTGGSVKTNTSDLKHPSAYVTLSSSTTVKANVNMEAAGKAKLVAYVGSTDGSSSKNVNTSIEAKLNNNALSLASRTFAEAGFGSSSNSRTYYSPVILGEYDFNAGANEIAISGKANNLNLGYITVLPVA